MREFERHQILQSRRMSGKRAATAESQLGVEGPEWADLIFAPALDAVSVYRLRAKTSY